MKHTLPWLLIATTVVAGPAIAIDNLPVFKGGVKPGIICQIPEAAKIACYHTMSPEGYLNCMQSAMRREKATAQAIAILQLSRGTVIEDKKYNNLTVIRVSVPAADHSDNYYIINNNGDVINVDDPAITSSIDITQAPHYSVLAQKYPNISLWSGNHVYPSQTDLPGGIYQLQFTYSLLNGCYACELAGIAKVGFNFDNEGQFLGAQLLNVDPPPVSTSSMLNGS